MPAPVDLIPPPLPATHPRGRWGWLGHLSILTVWIVAIMATAHFHADTGHQHTALRDVSDLLRRIALDTPVFALFCVGAWGCSRASADQWRLRWRGGLGPIWGGVLYSVAIRLAVLVAGVGLVLLVRVFFVVDAHTMSQLRPRVENAVDPTALVRDRRFFWLVVTVLSFYAGLIEEIWRGGMLAGLAGAFPRVFGGERGPWLAILPTSVLFGLAHLYMGWLAVGAATLLGCLLGAITVWHRTIWYAVVAHGCFDAASFAGLAWVMRHHAQMLGH